MVTRLARAEMVVDGVVQGVGFRYYVRRLARRLGLVGYVKNLDDGRVNIVCESTENRINEFVETMRNAPPPIKVEDITVSYATPTGEFKTFKIITADLAEEMVEGFSTGAAYFEIMFSKQDQALSKLDQILSKQDQMIERQDRMLEKQDLMLAKQDKMLEKQDQMLAKQDMMLEKQDRMLEKQDKMLEKQDMMLAKQDELLAEMKGIRKDFRSLIEERITKIERDIEAIKSKIGLTA
ncbi:MAG: acylphosphatase [Candidatus Caldarchaeum sp.]